MGLNFLTRHFPVPKFLKPPHIGISFSDNNIKAISVSGSHHRPNLKSIIVPLEDGVVVGGKVLNKAQLVKKLSVVKEYFSTPFVIFTIPDELVYIFETEVPFTKGTNGYEAVAFTIEENVPLSLADTVFDFTPVKFSEVEDESRINIVVAASVKKEIENFTESINESGLTVFGALPESQAITNALVEKGSTEAFCIVHARRDRLGIYLVRGGVVHFATIRNVLSDDYRGQFLDEYQKFLEYTERYGTDELARVKTVYVCGDFEFGKKVVAAMSESNGLLQNAKLANIWTNVLKIEEVTPSISYEDSLSFAGPVGSVLSDFL